MPSEIGYNKRWHDVKSNLCHIDSYIHCSLCLKDSGDDPYTQKLEVGWTKWGIQLWCREHNVNMIHMDFEDMKHPADTTRDNMWSK